MIGGGSLPASPVVADGKLHFASDEGVERKNWAAGHSKMSTTKARLENQRHV